MKIEFELDDIFARSEGISLETEIKREIVGQIIEFYGESLKKDIRSFIILEAKKVIQERITAAVPDEIENLLTQEYTPVAKYGERGEPTTLKKELHKSLVDQMVYKKTTYGNDKNAFSYAFDKAIAEKMSLFKAEWSRQVDATFVRDAMTHAANELSKRLGVGK